MHGQVADGTPEGGSGVLLAGGNGRLEIAGGFLRENEGAGLLALAPPVDRNETLRVVGVTVHDNGNGPGTLARAGIELRSARDVAVEGCDIAGHAGAAGSATDGTGILLHEVAGALVACNRVRAGERGIVLAGTTEGVSILHDRFGGLTAAALRIEAGAGVGSEVNESVFAGNAVAVENAGASGFNARHCWWGSADGATPPGSGEAVTGPVDVGDHIGFVGEPRLVRRPTNPGWSLPVAACHDALQPAIDAALPGELILVGEGRYFEHALIDAKPLWIEGVPGGSGCSPAQVDGQQANGSHVPALRIKNTAGARVRNLTIRGAGTGTVCGQAQGEEIGLDLQNVDQSEFTDLCFLENGVTELRLYGDSDGNLLQRLYVSGMIRDEFDRDLCGHRSREGILVDGGPACEGGPGASADDNRIVDIQSFLTTRAVSLRLAQRTEISSSVLHAVPAPAWNGGTLACGVLVDMSDDTRIVDNADIGNLGMTEGVRVQGRDAASCATEQLDSERTVVRGNTFDLVQGTGTAIRLRRTDGDPGAPVATDISCNTITGAATAVLVEHAGVPGPLANTVAANDIAGNGSGVDNLAPDLFHAERNWWGDAAGPSGAGPGAGDSVGPQVDFDPWLASSALDDADGDTFTECGGDPDDSDPQVLPLDGCDGADNDLDGSVDEDFAPGPTVCGVGACTSAGVSSCLAGVPGDSCTPGSPAANDATCDAVDDDCDGSADEDFLGAPTNCGNGGCAATGAMVCVAGQQQDSCVAGTPSAELCNGADDDCDGSVDDVALPPPAAGLGLAPAAGGTELAWPPLVEATGYDVARGSLATLLASAGDFTSSGDTCLANDLAAAALVDADQPLAGEGFWYLLRAVNCGGAGSFDTGDPGQSGTRDPEVVGCP